MHDFPMRACAVATGRHCSAPVKRIYSGVGVGRIRLIVPLKLALAHIGHSATDICWEVPHASKSGLSSAISSCIMAMLTSVFTVGRPVSMT